MNREELKSKPLYELRIIGRQTGVNNPTSKTKSDLIESILKVDSGEIPPYFTKNGRQPYPKSIALTKETIPISSRKIKAIDEILFRAKKQILAILKEDE